MWRICWMVLLAILAAGCSSTQLVSSWQNRQLAGYQRILTIGISQDPATRRIFEDSFSDVAQQSGVVAIPSYSAIPDAGRIPKEKIGDVVQQTQADAVLIMRLLDVSREIYTTPGRYYYGGYPPFGYYDWAWHGYYEPPRVYESVSVILETNLYDARTGELAWSGKTRTVDVEHLDNEMRQVSKVLVDAMRKQRVIGQ